MTNLQTPIAKVGKKPIQLDRLRADKGTLASLVGQRLVIVGVNDNDINAQSVVRFHVKGKKDQILTARIFCFKDHQDVLSEILENAESFPV